MNNKTAVKILTALVIKYHARTTDTSKSTYYAKEVKALRYAIKAIVEREYLMRENTPPMIFMTFEVVEGGGCP